MAQGRGLVKGGKEQEQKAIFEIQFLVHKYPAWGAPNRAPGP